MTTYKYGSSNLSHENASLSVPSLRWLGIKVDDLMFDNDSTGSSQAGENRGILGMSKRDRMKATNLLNKEPFTEEGAEPEWRSALQTMLMLNIKAEMESLSGRDGGLEGWTEEKLLAEQKRRKRTG